MISVSRSLIEQVITTTEKMSRTCQDKNMHEINDGKDVQKNRDTARNVGS